MNKSLLIMTGGVPGTGTFTLVLPVKAHLKNSKAMVQTSTQQSRISAQTMVDAIPMQPPCKSMVIAWGAQDKCFDCLRALHRVLPDCHSNYIY